MDKVLKAGLEHLAQQLHKSGCISHPMTAVVHLSQAIATLEAAEAEKKILCAKNDLIRSQADRHLQELEDRQAVSEKIEAQNAELRAEVERLRSAASNANQSAFTLEIERDLLRGTVDGVSGYLGCEPDNLLDTASKIHRVIEDNERLRAMVPKGEPIAWTDGATVRLASTVARYPTVAESHTTPLFALPEAPHD